MNVNMDHFATCASETLYIYAETSCVDSETSLSFLFFFKGRGIAGTHQHNLLT